MAIITRPRFKISQDPNSNKVQGLRVGDLALRQYFDNTTQFYSLLLVDEIGGTQATGNYFVGQLIDGDEPGATGVELLDFVRVTNIIDEERMGAVYISGTGSDAPRIDALADGGKEASVCWPTFLGAGGYEALNYTGTFGSGAVLDEPAINSKRAFKITRNSTPAAEAWYLRSSISLSKTNAGMIVDKQYVVSYRYRASKPMSISHSISDSDGTNSNGSWVDQFSTDWKYNAITFSCIFSTAGTQFHASLASVLSSGDWVEYADFTVVPLDSLKIIRSSVKSCVGNMNGIVDPVFGKLKDYGGYFQRLYATKDVNIAGTLTAGDENGFGTTFYAGKIAKNIIKNSDIRPENSNNGGVAKSVIQTSLPIGIVGSAVNLNVTGTDPTPLYYFGIDAPTQKKIITFSVWAKSTTGTSVTLRASDKTTSVGRVDAVYDLTTEWKRIHVSFDTSRLTSGNMWFYCNPNTSVSGNTVQLWGFQVEYSKTVTPYQPTDGTLSSSTDYGMWANRGGFGGTIQNPILKLQPDGTIVGGNNKLILRPDGSAEFNGTVVISGSGGQPLDVEQAINQAKSEAISTSSTDATTKANQAKLDAEAAAALDAAQKATQAKNDAISSAATDATNKAGTAKSEAISAASQDATTKANGAVTTALANTVTEIGKIANGDRNLLLNSGVEFGNIGYALGSKRYSPYERRKGAQYTITMCYTLGANNTHIGVYQNLGTNVAATFSTKGDRVVESKTFISTATDWLSPTLAAGFYQFPNDQFGSKIHWVTIVEGTKAPTTFIPAPEDIDSSINTQFNASKQFATDSITDLKNNYLGDLALMDTLDGGKITDGTIAFAKLGSTIISGGYIKTELLDANAIRTNIINVNYIEGLSLNFVRGNIGGWVISSTALTSAGNKTILRADGSGQLASGAISWNTAGAVTFNTSVKSNWESYADAAKASAISTSAADATSKANAAQSAAEAVAATKAALAKAEASAYADGIVDAEESRAIADAQAKLAEAKEDAQAKADAAKTAANAYTDASSSATLTASKQYANSSIADLKTNYLGDLAILDTLNGGKITDSTISFAKFGSTIVSGGYIKTELLDANAIRANIINVGYIEGLSLNFTKGFIGGWTISSAALSSIGNKSVLRSDGSGQLASGNIGWDAAGNVTFGANVQLNWKSYTDSAVAGVVVGGRNLYLNSGIERGSLSYQFAQLNYSSYPRTKLTKYTITVCYTLSPNVSHMSVYSNPGTNEVAYFSTQGARVIESKTFTPNMADWGSGEQYAGCYQFPNGQYGSKIHWITLVEGTKAPTTFIPAPEDSDYLKTHIDANGIYTGTLTTQQLNAAQATVLGNVTAGSFNIGSGKFSVSSDGTLNANGVNISGTLTSAAGNIGGWQINSDGISKGAININAGLQTIFVSKPGGGHMMLGQTYVNGGYTGNYGFSSTDPSNRPLVRMDGSINYIAGWQFDYSRIYSGTMELGSAGYIRNTADKWRLNQDGSGSFASGKFSFDAAGNTQIAGWRVATDLLASDGDKTVLRKDGSFKLASGQVVGDVAGNVTLGANVKLAWGTDPKNLLDWSGWTLGSDPVPNFNRISPGIENKREMLYGPNNKYSMVWVCESDGGNDASGGWTTDYVAVDKRYPYRYCCWVYSEESVGTRLHGCFDVSNLTGSSAESPNGSPYFLDSPATKDGEWYLMVGYIHPAGYQGSYIGVSGLYDSTGAKVANGTEYKLLNSSTSVRFRTYYFYATIAGARQLLYAPCVHKIDGTEPSLAQIIGNRVVTTHIDANGIYTGTLTATQVNAVEINASSIKTGNLTVGGTNAGGIGSVRVLDAANSELVTLGINGITATKGVIGGMTIAGNKLSGSSIDIQNEATIGGFKVTSYGLRNTVNQDAYIYIANTSGSGSSTVKRTAALGNAVSSTVGFDVASLFGASGPGENRAIVISATGSSSNWQIFGGKANIAIEAVGGISWKLNTGDHWCMPGLLKITEFNVTNSSISIARDWGNGFIMSKVQRIEHGVYRIVHDIGHTDYSVSIIAHEQNTDGNWWCSIPSIINKGIYQVEFSFRSDGGNRQNPSWFQVSFFGQQGNLAT